MIKERSSPRGMGGAKEPAHRLIRDAVEAEEIAVDWLHWAGFTDAARISSEFALGVRGADVLADVTFDPLPMERDALELLVRRAARHHGGLLVSFTFAGWTPETFVWANENDVPLIRYTFAGHVEPNNAAAEALQPR